MDTPTHNLHFDANHFYKVRRNLNKIFDNEITVVEETTAKAVPKKSSPQDKAVLPKKRHSKNIKQTNTKKLSSSEAKMPRRKLFIKTTSVLENLDDSSSLSSKESRFSGGGGRTAAQA
eukprot:scaffold148909_cov55-Cyclotella_meneghiniana.AAC.1